MPRGSKRWGWQPAAPADPRLLGLRCKDMWFEQVPKMGAIKCSGRDTRPFEYGAEHVDDHTYLDYPINHRESRIEKADEARSMVVACWLAGYAVLGHCNESFHRGPGGDGEGTAHTGSQYERAISSVVHVGPGAASPRPKRPWQKMQSFVGVMRRLLVCVMHGLQPPTSSLRFEQAPLRLVGSPIGPGWHTMMYASLRATGHGARRCINRFHGFAMAPATYGIDHDL